MNTRIIYTLLAVSAFALVSSATAHSPSTNANCIGYDFGNSALVTVGDHHVTTEPAVWQESNGIVGLQEHSHTCTNKTVDQNGTRTCGTKNYPNPCEILTFPADTSVI